jgi:hypothetical protein
MSGRGEGGWSESLAVLVIAVYLIVMGWKQLDCRFLGGVHRLR